jgi:hypothetical protein
MAKAENLIDYMRRRIETAVVEEEPFPHFVVDKLLPETIYQDILTSWPSPEFGRVTNWAARSELAVAEKLDLFPASLKPIWREVMEWTAVARDLVLQKFQPYLNQKYIPLLGRRRTAELTLVPHQAPAPFLASYTGRFELPPHVDSPFIVTNSYLYMSEFEYEEPELSTVLYRSFGLALPGNSIQPAGSLTRRYLRRAKIVPYCANRLFSYLNTPFAFHGVDAIDIGARLRRLLMFGIISDPQTFTSEERSVFCNSN